MTKEEAKKLRANDLVLVVFQGSVYQAYRNTSMKPYKEYYHMNFQVGREARTEQILCKDIRYLSEKPLIEAEELAKFEESKTFCRQFTLDWINKMVSGQEKAMAEFAENVAKDPVYTIKWFSEKLVVATYVARIGAGMLKWMERDPGIKLYTMLKEVVKNETSTQLDWISANSTSKWSNAIEEAEATSRVRWLRDARSYMNSAERYDV